MDVHDTGFTCQLCGTTYMYGSYHSQPDCRLRQIDALRAEVAEWHKSTATLLDQIHDLEQEVAALKAKYEGPLTDGQKASLIARADAGVSALMSAHGWQVVDAAIRKVRGES